MFTPIRLLVVGDSPVVRGAFAGDAGFDVVGEAAGGEEAVALAAALEPDVVLLDLRTPGVDGATVVERLRAAGVPARVLLIATRDTDVLPAIGAGATGHLLGDAPHEELFRAVRSAARGGAVLSPPAATRLLGRVRTPEPVSDPLSPRELDVLAHLAGGSTDREVARRLFVSEATVTAHLLDACAKLGVEDRASAVAAARARGLLRPGS